MIGLRDPIMDVGRPFLETILFVLALAITGLLCGLALGAWMSSDWMAKLISP